MNYKPIIITLGLITCFAFAFNNTDQKKINLEGSWKLEKFKDRDDNWQQYESDIIYQKHITPTHFTWISYNSREDKLIGMGGGSYVIDEKGNYIENVNYFFPSGSSILGQSIPFTVALKNGKWYHSGYAKEMEMGDDGSMKVTGSSKIEEIWSPIAATNKNNSALIGTWSLSSYKDEADGEYLEYPPITGSLKLITATHFIWVKYDKEGDQIYSAGSGEYKYFGDKYTEKLRLYYPKNTNINGQDIVFDAVVSSHQWKHKGSIPDLNNKLTSMEILIDEIWVPYSKVNDETATNY